MLTTVVRRAPSRYLGADEIARVTAAFGGVALRGAPSAACRGCYIDPCVINVMQGDRLFVSDYVCRLDDRIDDAHLTMIIEMLEFLRSGRR